MTVRPYVSPDQAVKRAFIHAMNMEPDTRREAFERLWLDTGGREIWNGPVSGPSIHDAFRDWVRQSGDQSALAEFEEFVAEHLAGRPTRAK